MTEREMMGEMLAQIVISTVALIICCEEASRDLKKARESSSLWNWVVALGMCALTVQIPWATWIGVGVINR